VSRCGLYEGEKWVSIVEEVRCVVPRPRGRDRWGRGPRRGVRGSEEVGDGGEGGMFAAGLVVNCFSRGGGVGDEECRLRRDRWW